MSKIKIFVGFLKREEVLSDLKWRNDICKNKIELVTSQMIDADEIVWPGMHNYDALMDIENVRLHLLRMAKATYEELTKHYDEAAKSGRIMAMLDALRGRGLEQTSIPSPEALQCSY